ncbi:actin-like protein [Novymonas esmeraldas]|uniref:Actin-like protein n=1 Tax=Novymonas esmeraldas TaxID=1808958 RepID=A0AAW0EP19_9TRYP
MQQQQQHSHTLASSAGGVRPSLSGTGLAAAPVFLLDLGSHTVKAGLHTDAVPHLTPALVGVPKYPRCLPSVSPAPHHGGGSSSSSSSSSRGVVVGHDAAAQRGLLRLGRPIQHGGVIADWAAARSLVQYCIRGALAPASVPSAATTAAAPRRSVVESEELVYSLVEGPFASRPQRARIAELLFEGGGEASVGPRAAGVFCGVAPLLALYATGQTTGLVVDVGDGAVSTAAAVDGYVLPQCLQREADGATGAAVTAYLTRLLYQSGTLGPAATGPGASVSAGTQQERELVYAIKEACCTVSATPVVPRPASLPAMGTCCTASTPSLDELNAALIAAAAAAQSSSASPSCTFTLPDGTAVEIGATAATQACEVLFHPLLLRSENRGLAVVVMDAVAAAPSELQAQLLGNVVVTGGVTCSAGFGKRLFHELQRRAGGGVSGQRICVTAPEQRAHAAWLGASYVAQLSSFVTHMVVTRAAYEEEGEGALARKVLT